MKIPRDEYGRVKEPSPTQMAWLHVLGALVLAVAIVVLIGWLAR